MRRGGEWHHGCFILDSSLAQIESTHVIEFRKISLPEESEIALQIDGKIFADFPGDLFDVEDWAVDGKQIHAKLHHIPEPKFLLNTRGFHWINEYPFNGYDE
jgi:hypothetical protein